LPNKKARLQVLEKETGGTDFWNDNQNAQKLLKERAHLASEVQNIERLQRAIDNCEAFVELYRETSDAELATEALQELEKVESEVDRLELSMMLCGEHDASSAILEINSGAGGTEAQDWGEMLLRMYLRWGERSGLHPQILSIQPGEGAGIKSATVLVEGLNAYGYLRSERGVHRLVRISPFDANSRRHTSFASVSVMPDIEEDVEISINEQELRIDTYRSSGAGGQHVNKTDSAVRLTHLPTNIVVTCQNERSQHKNKATAMRLLKAKLYEMAMDKKQEELEKIAGERKKIDFGSQIRSYVMQPYQLVKDLRTGAETGNVQAVMDGNIDQFMKSYLLSEEWNRA